MPEPKDNDSLIHPRLLRLSITRDKSQMPANSRKVVGKNYDASRSIVSIHTNHRANIAKLIVLEGVTPPAAILLHLLSPASVFPAPASYLVTCSTSSQR